MKIRLFKVLHWFWTYSWSWNHVVSTSPLEEEWLRGETCRKNVWAHRWMFYTWSKNYLWRAQGKDGPNSLLISLFEVIQDGAATRLIFVFLYIYIHTVMIHLTTGLRSEKCVVKRCRHRANIIVCTYTNLDGIAYCSKAANLYSMLLHWILSAIVTQW